MLCRYRKKNAVSRPKFACVRIVKTIDVCEGENVSEVNLSGLPKGLYVVNLVECGVIIDNLKISLP